MKKQMRIFAILLAIMMLFAACSGSNEAPATADDGIKDGSYTVKAKGYDTAPEYDVTTTFEGGKIKEITVGDNQETEGIGSAALEKLPAAVVEAQSLSVDVVTGATVTSENFLAAVEAAIVEAGGKAEDWKKAVEKTTGEDIELETDVLVIGGGGAGLSAAVSAAQNDAKVVLLEKTSALGGNTIRAGGPFNAVDPERQKNNAPASEAAMSGLERLYTHEALSDEHQKWMDELKSDLDAYNAGPKDHLFDSNALHVLQTYDGGDYAGKLEFIEKLVTSSLDTAHWLEDNGLKWRDEIGTVPGGLWPRAHIPENAAGSDYIKTNGALAEKLGVDILFDCAAKELIVEDGRVVGVKAEKADGSKVTVRASRGVVMATGGFAANKEMRQKWMPSLIESLGTTNSPAITGDGITMGEAVGANLIGMEYIQCLPLGNPETGGLNGWIGGKGVENYYQINKEGKRFMAEDGRRDEMTAALLAQDDAFSYVITDTNDEIETGINLWGDNVDELVKQGLVFRADTIEDLAKEIGVDPEVLKETHEAFNRYAEAGLDEEFGRKLFSRKIDNPPFYASPRKPTVHHTMGGLEIDLECHVLDKDGKVIPGLFAAGEVTGGIHGKNRLGGNALVDIHVFGRIAGEMAAKNQ